MGTAFGLGGSRFPSQGLGDFCTWGRELLLVVALLARIAEPASSPGSEAGLSANARGSPPPCGERVRRCPPVSSGVWAPPMAHPSPFSEAPPAPPSPARRPTSLVSACQTWRRLAARPPEPAQAQCAAGAGGGGNMEMSVASRAPLSASAVELAWTCQRPRGTPGGDRHTTEAKKWVTEGREDKLGRSKSFRSQESPWGMAWADRGQAN